MKKFLNSLFQATLLIASGISPVLAMDNSNDIEMGDGSTSSAAVSVAAGAATSSAASDSSLSLSIPFGDSQSQSLSAGSVFGSQSQGSPRHSMQLGTPRAAAQTGASNSMSISPVSASASTNSSPFSFSFGGTAAGTATSAAGTSFSHRPVSSRTSAAPSFGNPKIDLLNDAIINGQFMTVMRILSDIRPSELRQTNAHGKIPLEIALATNNTLICRLILEKDLGLLNYISPITGNSLVQDIEDNGSLYSKEIHTLIAEMEAKMKGSSATGKNSIGTYADLTGSMSKPAAPKPTSASSDSDGYTLTMENEDDEFAGMPGLTDKDDEKEKEKEKARRQAPKRPAPFSGGPLSVDLDDDLDGMPGLTNRDDEKEREKAKEKDAKPARSGKDEKESAGDDEDYSDMPALEVDEKAARENAERQAAAAKGTDGERASKRARTAIGDWVPDDMPLDEVMAQIEQTEKGQAASLSRPSAPEPGALRPAINPMIAAAAAMYGKGSAEEIAKSTGVLTGDMDVDTANMMFAQRDSMEAEPTGGPAGSASAQGSSATSSQLDISQLPLTRQSGATGAVVQTAIDFANSLNATGSVSASGVSLAPIDPFGGSGRPAAPSRTAFAPTHMPAPDFSMAVSDRMSAEQIMALFAARESQSAGSGSQSGAGSSSSAPAKKWVVRDEKKDKPKKGE